MLALYTLQLLRRVASRLAIALGYGLEPRVPGLYCYSFVVGFAAHSVVCVVEGFVHEGTNVRATDAGDMLASGFAHLHEASQAELREVLAGRGCGRPGEQAECADFVLTRARSHRIRRRVGSASIGRVAAATSTWVSVGGSKAADARA